MTNKELIEKLRAHAPTCACNSIDEVVTLCDRLEAADAEIDRLKGLVRWMHKQMNFVWDGDAFTIFTGLEDCPEKTEIEKIVGAG
jgi:hypothetical protein